MLVYLFFFHLSVGPMRVKGPVVQYTNENNLQANRAAVAQPTPPRPQLVAPPQPVRTEWVIPLHDAIPPTWPKVHHVSVLLNILPHVLIYYNYICQDSDG